jgi:hypothetical protein
MWLARCGAQQRHTASTSNALDTQTRIGRIGTPSTWFGSKAEQRRLNDSENQQQ